MTNITIVGPNLRDQSKGSFHVHSADCQDLHKPAYRNAETSTIDAASEQAVIEFIYEDIIAENEGDTWESYRTDFHILPCVKFDAPTQRKTAMNENTIVVFNTKTNKVGFVVTKKLSNEQLTAACEAIPNGFAEELGNLKMAELVDIHNANADKDTNEVKRFPNKATAIERVISVLGEIPAWDGQEGTAPPVPENTSTALSEGVAKSWTDPAVRAARSQRHGVKVDGKEFPSLQAAYREFDLDQKDHREFRKLLKADCSKKHKRHGRTWQAFER